MNVSRNFVKAVLLSVTLSNVSWGVNLEPEPTNTTYKNRGYTLKRAIVRMDISMTEINFGHIFDMSGNSLFVIKLPVTVPNTEEEKTIINHLPLEEKTVESNSIIDINIPNTEIIK